MLSNVGMTYRQENNYVPEPLAIKVKREPRMLILQIFRDIRFYNQPLIKY